MTVATKPEASSSEKSRPSLRVLVADDDALSRKLLTSLLTKWNYEVVAVQDGAEALKMLQSDESPRLALLDWMMPGVSGTEVCQQIRALPRSQYTFTILLSGRDDRKDLIAGLESGADDYITKPFDPDELRVRLETGSRIVLQKALRESEERFQSAFDRAGVGMALVGTEGQWIQVNGALCSLLGYSKGELLATENFPAISIPEDRQRLLLALQKLLFEDVDDFEGRYVQHDGRAVWAITTLSLVRNSNGQPACFIAQIQNIDKRKQAEEAVREAHRESELIINSVPSILIGIDNTGKIGRWNVAAESVFGLTEATVRGRPLGDCGIVWLSPDLAGEFDSWLQLKTPLRRDNMPFQKKGEPHFLGVTVTPVKYSEQENVGLLITGADVTERKHLEDQLRQAQKLEAIGQLAAGIAHEINTPTQYVGDNTNFFKESWPAISEVLSCCQKVTAEAAAGEVTRATLDALSRSIEKADLDYLLAEVPKSIDQSLEGLQRVAKIVRAMKEFSHPDSPDKRAVDLNKSIETTITVARNEWKYVAEVSTNFDPNLPPVPCFAGEFNQVILNLIVNAAHAIKEANPDGKKGSIVLGTRNKENTVEISIRDTGAGIPEAIRSRIFEPFFTTKEVGKGTGQGLALAHSVIVKKHGGKIWFTSEPGSGTTFFLELPLNFGLEEEGSA